MGTGDAGRLRYSGITAQRQALMDSWVRHPGGGVKFFLIYERAFWRAPYFNGSAAIPALGAGTGNAAARANARAKAAAFRARAVAQDKAQAEAAEAEAGDVGAGATPRGRTTPRRRRTWCSRAAPRTGRRRSRQATRSAPSLLPANPQLPARTPPLPYLPMDTTTGRPTPSRRLVGTAVILPPPLGCDGGFLYTVGKPLLEEARRR